MVKMNPQGPFYRPLYNLGSPVDLVWLLGLPDAHCMGAGQVDLVNIYRLTFDPKKKKKPEFLAQFRGLSQKISPNQL